jgi:thiol-disulfide isomerase/thioredoxin
MLPLSEWQTLLAVHAGASATLTGLVFVAVSINIAKIIEIPGLSGRAGDSIQHVDFTLTDLDHKPWVFRQLAGKVVLVNFWATWCPPCRKETLDLDALNKEFRDKGLVILAISDEDRATVAPFIAEQKLTCPVLLDPGRVVNVPSD